MLGRMEKKGLVTKAKDPVRKNLVRITLTEKGRRAHQQSTERQSIHQVMSCLSEDDKRELRLLLERLRSKTLKALCIEEELPFPRAGAV